MTGIVVWLPAAGAELRFRNDMTRTTRHRGQLIAVWLLTAAFAFGGVAEAGPAVLCIGDDGHSDIEYSLAGCCVLETDDAEQTESAAMIASRPGCDDCVDLGLDQNSLKAGKRLFPAPEATLLRLSLPQREIRGAKTSAAAQCTVRDSLTTVISSTVLLI